MKGIIFNGKEQAEIAVNDHKGEKFKIAIGGEIISKYPKDCVGKPMVAGETCKSIDLDN